MCKTKLSFFRENKNGRTAPHNNPNWGCTRTHIFNEIHVKISNPEINPATSGQKETRWVGDFKSHHWRADEYLRPNSYRSHLLSHVCNLGPPCHLMFVTIVPSHNLLLCYSTNHPPSQVSHKPACMVHVSHFATSCQSLKLSNYDGVVVL